jgi:hypothetical protein
MATTYMTTWEVNEEEFHDLTNYIHQNIYAFQHGENQDLKVEVVGYISNEPGIIYDFVNCYSFTESEIAAWKKILIKFGAKDVHIEIDTIQRTMTMQVFFEKKASDTKTSYFCSLYKLLAVWSYIPTFVWAYAGLVAWNKERYLLL